MFGLDLLTASTWLVLAGGPVTCQMPKAPTINVTPQTKEIVYDYSRSAAALGAIKSNTVSPFAPDADVSTGGLREDRPVTEISVQWRTTTWPDRGLVCLYYDQVDVTMTLSPTIYVAKENQHGACKTAILEHERKHVKVDREVVNKYMRKIGQAVKAAVDSKGAMGPYKVSQLDAVQKKLVATVQDAAERYNVEMSKEMRRRQAAVDTLQEYERVSRICQNDRDGARR